VYEFRRTKIMAFMICDLSIGGGTSTSTTGSGEITILQNKLKINSEYKSTCNKKCEDERR